MTQRALTHHIVTYGTVRNLCTNIECVLFRSKIINVLRKSFPFTPFDTLEQRGAGNIFDPFHQLNHSPLTARRAWGKSNATVTHHYTRHAMAKGWVNLIVPTDLAIKVSVDINPARRRIGSVSIDCFFCTAVYFTHCRNLATFNGHITAVGFVTQPINNRCVLYKVVVHSCYPF